MSSTTIKRTYALDQPVVQEFERAVKPGKRSAAIEAMMKDFLDRQAREALRQDIIEGCHAMAEANIEIEQAFRTADEEASRAFLP